MSRVTALIALLLVVPTSAAGKEPPSALRFCGTGACRTIDAGERLRVLRDALSQAGPGVRAARPAPYFTVQYVWGDGSLDETTRMYVVPAAGVLRTGFVAEWRPLGQREGVFRWATRGLRPFPAPRFSSAEVDGRPVRDPSSYGRLFAVSGPAARDPAGRQPSLYYWDREGWTRYYERVRRHWIPVNMWSVRPSPWGDGDNYLWISRRGSLLKRDGEVLRISGGLADCIRAAASLRACG